MTTKAFRVVHHITEGTDPRPIVTHLFYGDTPEEAQSIYAAHKKTDQFLRECDEKGLFAGKVNCRSAAFLEKVNG